MIRLVFDTARCWLSRPHLIMIGRPPGVAVCTHCFNELEEH